jgi:hypothetical protein
MKLGLNNYAHKRITRISERRKLCKYLSHFGNRRISFPGMGFVGLRKVHGGDSSPVWHHIRRGHIPRELNNTTESRRIDNVEGKRIAKNEVGNSSGKHGGVLSMK